MTDKAKNSRKAVLKSLKAIQKQVTKLAYVENEENVKGAVSYLKNQAKRKIGTDGLTDKERKKMAAEYGRRVRFVTQEQNELVTEALQKRKKDAEDRRNTFLQALARAYMLSQAVPKIEIELPVNYCPDDDPVGEPRPMEKTWATDVNSVVEKMAKLLEEKGYDFSKPSVRLVDLGVAAEERAAAAEAKLEQFRVLMKSYQLSAELNRKIEHIFTDDNG